MWKGRVDVFISFRCCFAFPSEIRLRFPLPPRPQSRPNFPADFLISLFVRCGSEDPSGPCRLLREWRIHVSGLLCVGSEVRALPLRLRSVQFEVRQAEVALQLASRSPLHHETPFSRPQMPPTNALSADEDLLVLQFGELFYTTYQAEETPEAKLSSCSDPDSEVRGS